MERFVTVNRTASHVFFAFVVAVIATVIGYQLWIGAYTMPRPGIEAFAGPPKGAGAPDCMRTSSEAAELYSMMAGRNSTTEEGPDDFQELTVLLGKLSCFKNDLMGVAQVVSATRKQPFRTSQDMEPVAETAARCFAKTIPKRDLELSFDKWNKRGTQLIRRLCTSFDFTATEQQKALNLFAQVIGDVSDVAKSVCLSGPPTIAGAPGPRMVTGYEPGALSMLREYNGYY